MKKRTTPSWRGERNACPISVTRTFVIAGYIIRNRPIGTPRLMAFATVGSNVPAAISFNASIGGVRVKSEIERTFPIAIPIAMLTTT
ncbi:MAG TPA: hypothetical protein VJZ72_00685 [Candidatus Limnocylindrales bacterium]|nr:hypothetical protein [Candidatus Limnocylindrales bacterium]